MMILTPRRRGETVMNEMVWRWANKTLKTDSTPLEIFPDSFNPLGSVKHV